MENTDITVTILRYLENTDITVTILRNIQGITTATWRRDRAAIGKRKRLNIYLVTIYHQTSKFRKKYHQTSKFGQISLDEIFHQTSQFGEKYDPKDDFCSLPAVFIYNNYSTCCVNVFFSGVVRSFMSFSTKYPNTAYLTWKKSYWITRKKQKTRL